jgi:hypothetical protein
MVDADSELPKVRAAPSADAIPAKLRRRGGSPRQVLALTVVGTLVLAVFASRDLATWLDRQGGGPMLQATQRAAAQWDGAMDWLGVTWPHEALRLAMRRLLDWQWGSPP